MKSTNEKVLSNWLTSFSVGWFIALNVFEIIITIIIIDILNLKLIIIFCLFIRINYDTHTHARKKCVH